MKITFFNKDLKLETIEIESANNSVCVNGVWVQENESGIKLSVDHSIIIDPIASNCFNVTKSNDE